MNANQSQQAQGLQMMSGPKKFFARGQGDNTGSQQPIIQIGGVGLKDGQASAGGGNNQNTLMVAAKTHFVVNKPSFSGSKFTLKR